MALTGTGDLTMQLARHIAQTRYAQLPATTRQAAKRALLDAIGVMSAASGLAPEARPFIDLARERSADAAAMVLGTGIRTTAEIAALANGALAHALDYEDAFDRAPLHPDASLVPAVLALAQLRAPVHGEEVVTAIATGCDFACRLALSLRQPLEQGGWYPPPILGAFGAVAGAARLLALGAEQVRDAWSLLLLQNSCPGEIRHDGETVLRAVREAFPAQAAVTAVLLAQRGIRGFSRVFEGQGGFFALFAGGRYDSADLLDGLGVQWHVDALSFKPWPSCRGTHAAIEASLRLRSQPGFDPQSIEDIRIDGGAVQAMLAEPAARKQAPLTAIDARFSLPFTVATALHHGAVTLDSFTPQALADAGVLRLAARCRFRLRGDRDPRNAVSGEVGLRLTDGRELVEAVPEPLGSPARPLGDAALVHKFIDCVGQAARPMAPDKARQLADRILRAEEEPDAGTLAPDSTLVPATRT